MKDSKFWSVLLILGSILGVMIVLIILMLNPHGKDDSNLIFACVEDASGVKTTAEYGFWPGFKWLTQWLVGKSHVLFETDSSISYKWSLGKCKEELP